MTRPRPAAERALARCVENENGCWIFTGALHRGYGKIARGARGAGWAPVHRVVYEYLVGEIPPGLTIDHLCRTPACANPWHMEPVTVEENTRRGRGWEVRAAQMRATSVCKQGHPYDRVRSDGARACRTCQREWTRASRARRRAVA